MAYRIKHKLEKDLKAGEEVDIEVPQEFFDKVLGARYAKIEANAEASAAGLKKQLEELQAENATLKTAGTAEIEKKLGEAKAAARKEAEAEFAKKAKILENQKTLLEVLNESKLALTPVYRDRLVLGEDETKESILAKAKELKKQQDADFKEINKGFTIGSLENGGSDTDIQSADEKQMVTWSNTFYQVDGSLSDAMKAKVMKIRIEKGQFDPKAGQPKK